MSEAEAVACNASAHSNTKLNHIIGGFGDVKSRHADLTHDHSSLFVSVEAARVIPMSCRWS